MNLKEEDIINALESYRRYRNMNQADMAKLCGMKSKSVYSDWSNGKSKGKLIYLLEFFNNTKIDKEKFFREFDIPNKEKTENELMEPTSPNYNSKCNDPECLKEKYDLLMEIRKLGSLVNKLLTEKNERLEKQKGAPEPGKKVVGDVEKPKQTGT